MTPKSFVTRNKFASTWATGCEEEVEEEVEDLSLCVLPVSFSSLSFLPPCRVGRVLCVLTVFSVFLFVFLSFSPSLSSSHLEDEIDPGRRRRRKRRRTTSKLWTIEEEGERRGGGASTDDAQERDEEELKEVEGKGEVCHSAECRLWTHKFWTQEE